MVIINNRRMIFSEEDRYIGTRFDNGSTVRTFQVARYDGTYDLSNLTFHLEIKYSDTNEIDILATEKTVTEDGKLNLAVTFTAQSLTHSGTHIVQLVGFEDTGNYKWSTYQSLVYIEDSLTSVPISVKTLSMLESYEAQLTNKLLLLTVTENKVTLSETARIAAESLRVSAEEARVKAEQSRADAEQLREETEKIRNNAEAGRVTAETNRAEAEAAREKAEAIRESQREEWDASEAAIKEAENTRADNESNRVSAEAARVKAESSRVVAETARVEAENERNKQTVLLDDDGLFYVIVEEA